jgi:hypothetical protein
MNPDTELLSVKSALEQASGRTFPVGEVAEKAFDATVVQPSLSTTPTGSARRSKRSTKCSRLSRPSLQKLRSRRRQAQGRGRTGERRGTAVPAAPNLTAKELTSMDVKEFLQAEIDRKLSRPTPSPRRPPPKAAPSPTTEKKRGRTTLAEVKDHKTRLDQIEENEKHP